MEGRNNPSMNTKSIVAINSSERRRNKNSARDTGIEMQKFSNIKTTNVSGKHGDSHKCGHRSTGTSA
jgi:hypothetical protein